MPVDALHVKSYIILRILTTLWCVFLHSSTKYFISIIFFFHKIIVFCFLGKLTREIINSQQLIHALFVKWILCFIFWWMQIHIFLDRCMMLSHSLIFKNLHSPCSCHKRVKYSFKMKDMAIKLCMFRMIFRRILPYH